MYSEHPEEDAPHSECIAFMTNKKARKALISGEPVSPCIITARFSTKLNRWTTYMYVI